MVEPDSCLVGIQGKADPTESMLRKRRRLPSLHPSLFPSYHKSGASLLPHVSLITRRLISARAQLWPLWHPHLSCLTVAERCQRRVRLQTCYATQTCKLSEDACRHTNVVTGDSERARNPHPVLLQARNCCRNLHSAHFGNSLHKHFTAALRGHKNAVLWKP